MPLLGLEPCLYPEDLLAGSDRINSGPGRWWVLHTRPRMEKSLARQCLGAALSFYLPLHHKQWRARGRTLRSYVPLFPGYVFIHGDDETRTAALQTNLVAQVLPVADQAQLHDDLMRLHRLIDSDAPVTPEDRLQPGAPVRVIHGSLAGMEGKVLRRDDKHCRFFIEVRFLQRGVSAELENWMIEAL
ncbi:MAG: hypothetical protein L0Y71_10715 [Gemmataceae bacterium]|nr:hypothetical protein [Gemmataceae bacterium]